MAEILNGAFVLTTEKIRSFIDDFSRRSRSVSSVETYKRRLEFFYEGLSEDKIIRPGTLSEVREKWLAQNIPNRSINLTVSAVNSLLDYYGRRDLQLIGTLENTKCIVPELTRAEYLRLLTAAKALDKRRAYLLVKAFAVTGLNSRDLQLLTVEAVREKRMVIPERGVVPISSVLCRELAAYCSQAGRYSGPVFVTREGKPLNRTAANTEIHRLAKDARVDEAKCNPITLRRLYLATQEQIMTSFAALIEQSHERLLESEQLTTGWE